MTNREKVIKKAERIICSAVGRDMIDSFCEDVITLLEEQKCEWVSVKDRLPEVRHAVLCYSPHHKNIWALSLHEDGEWYYWISGYKKYNPDFEGPITHWMPLPEPPEVT